MPVKKESSDYGWGCEPEDMSNWGAPDAGDKPGTIGRYRIVLLAGKTVNLSLPGHGFGVPVATTNETAELPAEIPAASVPPAVENGQISDATVPRSVEVLDTGGKL